MNLKYLTFVVILSLFAELDRSVSQGFNKSACADRFSFFSFEHFWWKDLLSLAEDGFAQRFELRRLKGRDEKTFRVGIVGAGATGLTTAYELAKYAVESGSSVEITIIEKENRLGGKAKTIGKKGDFLPNLWTNEDDDAFGEGGAMRLPMIPQEDLRCKYGWICERSGINCDVRSMSDEEMQSLVHGEGAFAEVRDEDFPAMLVRHYVKKFKIPVVRFNMRQAGADLFGTFFVRSEDDIYRTVKGETINDYALKMVESLNPDFALNLRRKYNGSLELAFEMCTVREILKWTENHSVLFMKDPSKLNDKLDAFMKFQDFWNVSYREFLINKGWPDSIIKLYWSLYRFYLFFRFPITIGPLSKMWQENGMYTLRNGLTSLFRKPKRHEKQSVDAYTCFYDELLKMNSGQVKTTFKWHSPVEDIKQIENGDVQVKNCNSVIGTYDAVVSTISATDLGKIAISSSKYLSLSHTNFLKSGQAMKIFVEFKTPFWKNTSNNLGEFKVGDKQGYVSTTDNIMGFYYPRHTKQSGNIVFSYPLLDFASSIAHLLNDHEGKYSILSKSDEEGVWAVINMTLNKLQRFHPNVNVSEMFTGSYAIEPWMNIPLCAWGQHNLEKLQQFVTHSPKGLYFAGDGFSFKPVWIDGALVTAYHALFRLLNDFTNAQFEDPFKFPNTS